MKAFHVKFDEAKLDSNIQKWDVEVLQVGRSYKIDVSISSFIDKQVKASFGQGLHVALLGMFGKVKY